MPHVSKKILSEKTLLELEENLFNVLIDTTGKERKSIFKELYTPTERAMFAKRLGMLALIDRDVSTHTISNLLGVSPSTVARFEVVVSRHGFVETRRALKKHHVNNQLLRFLTSVATMAIDGKRSSLRKLIERR